VVKGNLLSGATHPGTEVAAMQRQQPLAGDETEPEKRRQSRVGSIRRCSSDDVKLRFLEHIRWVDASLEPSVQP
jgi:hypothetical protein